MKNKDLIKRLQELPEDLDVWVEDGEAAWGGSSATRVELDEGFGIRRIVITNEDNRHD